ncbi:hypothetical protein PUN28_010753 [Cardiocondyla obscurior]|uniref:Ribosomal protein L20 n=1 Tax=Cardiocondyla obscurior TaxID=286306 RepID=A0AAW2FNF6_9HYME
MRVVILTRRLVSLPPRFCDYRRDPRGFRVISRDRKKSGRNVEFTHRRNVLFRGRTIHTLAIRAKIWKQLRQLFRFRLTTSLNIALHRLSVSDPYRDNITDDIIRIMFAVREGEWEGSRLSGSKSEGPSGRKEG